MPCGDTDVDRKAQRWVLNAGFLWYALGLLRTDDEQLPMHTFAYSVTYLMLLFAFLLVDHYFHLMTT